MQKLNIAILSYRSAKFGGGQGVYIKDISFALSLMGHNVDVISGPPYPDLHDGVKLIKLPGLDLFETFSFKDRYKKFKKKKSKNFNDMGINNSSVAAPTLYAMLTIGRYCIQRDAMKRKDGLVG